MPHRYLSVVQDAVSSADPGPRTFPAVRPWPDVVMDVVGSVWPRVDEAEAGVWSAYRGLAKVESLASRALWVGPVIDKVAVGGVLRLTVAGMLRGMSEADGPGDKAQQLKAQVTQKARDVGAQAMARAPQLTGAAAQQAQRVVQDKPGAAVGATLAVLGLLILGRRRQRRRKKDKTQQVRGRSRTSRRRRWARALAVVGLLVRLRRRKRQEDA